LRDTIIFEVIRVNYRLEIKMARRDKKPGFDSELCGSTLKIKLRGEIDHHSAVAVRTSIDDIIKKKQPDELVIDMSAVNFMDSSGLGLIMGRYALMKQMGGNTVVADPNARIEKIMRLAGLERIVPIRHTVVRASESAPTRAARPRPRVHSGSVQATAHTGQALNIKGNPMSDKKGEDK
jgi:stage II sporulation protein AA (anti-sigma F factor antagonist)